MARRPNRSRRQRIPQVADVQNLEPRLLLTGDVTAVIEDGNLVIEGDAAANQLELTYFKGDVSIRSRQGTRINGQTGRTVLIEDTDTIPGNVMVTLQGGHDEFLVSRDLKIEGDLTVRGGIGNDTFGMLRTEVGGYLKVLMGSGRDAVSIDDVSVSGDFASIRGNNGRDSLRIVDSVFAPELLVSTGRGHDDVAIEMVRTDGNATVLTGEHDDHVSITSGRFKAGLEVVTSVGEDTVQILDTRVATETSIGLGADNDQLSLGATGLRNIFSGEFVVNGSGGNNTYEENNNLFQATREVARATDGTIDEATLEEAMTRTESALASAMEMFLYKVQSLEGSVPDGTETVGGKITRADAATVFGITTNDALIEIDLNGDEVFDDITLRADEFGVYELPLELTDGLNHLRMRSTDDSGTEQFFDVKVHRAVGTVVRFNTSLGAFDVELLDDEAPLTVAAYLEYLDSDEFGVIHRSVNDFIIQGGGFEFTDGQIGTMDSNGSVENEFTEENSNLRGTLSTALLGGQPDSATNQWFVNLADNIFLDDDQHTVFGRVIADGLDVADAINELSEFNLDGGVFSQTPLRNFELYSEQITGTVTTEQGSATLVGDETLFTEELQEGQILQVRNGEDVIGTFIVESIESDTEATMTTTAAEDSSGSDGFYHEELGIEHFVISDLEELLISL
jgi:cyclophilin family peptidyl-prolyl cis-trans isomerase